MVAVQGLLGIKGKKGKALFRVVAEFLLDHEGDGDVSALVDFSVADKAVHPGPQDKGFGDGRADDVKVGELVFGAACVLFSEIGIQRTQVNVNTDVGLVVGPVGHDAGHDPVHGGQVLQPDAILPVTPFSSFLRHKKPP